MKIAVVMIEKLDGITGYYQSTRKNTHFNGIQKKCKETSTGDYKITRNKRKG
jgi:hypothetical protein